MLRVGATLTLGLLLCACSGLTVHRGEALTQPVNKPVLVVDLDDTVAPAPWSGVHTVVPGRGPGALPDSAAVLTRLSATHQVVFLTSRAAPTARGTLRWLDAEGFPHAPVIFSRGVLMGEEQHLAHKRGTLQKLRASGFTIAFGVGDKPADMASYQAAGATAVFIAESETDRDLAGARELDPPPTIVIGHADAWRRIEPIVAPGR